MADTKVVHKNLNKDPITGEHGSHPVGVAAGAGAGAAAGAALGAIGGPIGVVAGAAAGGIAGGLAGKAAGEAANPTVEAAYWKDNYKTRPYYTDTLPYADIHPAYQYGWETYPTYAGKSFDDVETDLQRGWETKQPKVEWKRARVATRDAWDRLSAQRRA